MGDFFGNAVKSLNINIPSEYISEESSPSNDQIENIISKYSNHPSIKLINENTATGNFSFIKTDIADIENEIAALDGKKASMSRK